MHGDLPEILAHRAGPVRKGLPWHAEQTLPAFAETWARERVVCELDVRFTADGVPVVFHDATLQRITGVAGRLDQLEAAEFRMLRADLIGADRTLARAERPVPLAVLGDVLEFARRTGAHLNVELKNLPGEPAFDPTAGTAERLARTLLASGIPAHRLTAQSFWPDDVAALGARLAGVRRSLLVAPGHAEAGIENAVAIGADAVGLAWPVAPDVIRSAKERRLVVMAYTVNDPVSVRSAARGGVDAIITDDPAAARLALAPALAA